MPLGQVQTLKRKMKRLLELGERYDLKELCTLPIERLDASTWQAGKDRGGWRSYASVIIERTWADIFAMDVFLTHTWPRVIVELGTGSGAFSCYLATYCYLTRARFFTFDIHRKGSVTKRVNYRSLGLIHRLGGRYYPRNIFHESTQQLIRRLTHGRGTALIYCDNGDKAREIQLYAQLLKGGDFIGAHDYGSEIVPEDVKVLLDSGRCEPWQEAFFERLGSSNRFFRIVRRGREV